MSEAKWIPACGGTEEAFRTKSGIRVLYVWNGKRHAYLNLDTDIIMSDEEVAANFL